MEFSTKYYNPLLPELPPSIHQYLQPHEQIVYYTHEMNYKEKPFRKRLGEHISIVTKLFIVFKDPIHREFVEKFKGKTLVENICFRNVDVQGITIHKEQKGEHHKITEDGTYHIYNAPVRKDIEYTVPCGYHWGVTNGGFLSTPLERTFSFRFSDNFFEKYFKRRLESVHKIFSILPDDVIWMISEFDSILSKKDMKIPVDIFLSYLSEQPRVRIEDDYTEEDYEEQFL